MKLTTLVWLILSFIWGTTWLFIKLGLQDIPPFTFAYLRFTIAVIPICILLFIQREQIPRSAREWRLIILTGFLTISWNYGLIFWAELYISSGLTAVFYSIFPLFGLIIANLELGGEAMNRYKIAGVIFGIIGTALVFYEQIVKMDSSMLYGSIAVLLAALGTAYANVMVKAHGSQITPLAMTAGQMGVGIVPLFIISIIFEGNALSSISTPLAWISILYLSLVGSALALVLLYWLMQRMDVTKTQLIPFASTIIAVVLGKLVLKEAWGWFMIVGGIMTLSGLFIAAIGYRQSPGIR